MFRRVLTYLAACSAAVVTGCSTQGNVVPGGQILDPLGYEIVDRFPTQLGNGTLRKNRLTGVYDVQPGPRYAGAPINGLLRVDSAKHAVSGKKTLLFVNGKSESCENEHLLLVLDNQFHAWHVGDCHDQLAISITPQQDVVFTETGVADPNVWVWHNTQMDVVGPIKQNTVSAELKTPGQRAVVPKAPAPHAASTQSAAPSKDYHVADPGEVRASAPTDSISLPPLVQERQVDGAAAVWKINTDPQ